MDELTTFFLKEKGKYITIDFENGKRMVISDIDKKARKMDKKYVNNKIKLTISLKNGHNKVFLQNV